MRKVLIFIFSILALAINAQTGKLFDADKQLSSSFTNQVYLDRDGFIWVVTRNGLNRYDGYQFHIIKKEQETGNGMASNYVNCMTQDANGLFFMGMYGALQTYDGKQFHDVEVKDLEGHIVSCYITCFLSLRNGGILAGTSGLGLLRITDRSHAVQQNGPLKNIHTIHAMAEDARGHVWILTSRHGLLDYDGKSAKSYFNNTEESTLTSICIDPSGNIYVGTTNNGAYIRSGSGGDFHHLDVTGSKHVSTIYCLRDGRIMFGYDGLGLGIYNPKTGEMTDNPYYCRDVDLSMGKVYSIVEDLRGNIWLGLMQKGIYMQPHSTTGFNYLGYKLGQLNHIGQACVNSTIIDREGRCWIGTDKDGLYCLDHHQRPLHHFKDGGFPSTVMSLAEDSLGRIWVGSYSEGFGYIDASGSSYHKYPQHATSSGFSIQATPNDVWVATMGQGLLRIGMKDNQLKAYTMHERATEVSSVNSIANNYISKISISPDGKRLYAATTMGVCCLDIEKESWTNLFSKNCLNYGTPCRIVKEYDGKLWIGTNNGLNCYDLKKRQLQVYTTEDGLADNGICSIEQDKEGRLWISTDHGLCCHNPKTGLTESYFVDDGLQSNEFSDGASWNHQRGVMLFGGVAGITWFRPEQIHQDKWKAKVSLVSFIVNRKPINSNTLSGGRQICDTTVLASNRFTLSHHDNSFAVQFSTLTYDNPEHIVYHYSINGEAFTRLQPGVNELTFTHLSPGTYRFRVKAERNHEMTDEREFTVVVRPAWYQTTWAYALYLLALGALVWYYITDRRKKEEARLMLQEHIHTEQMGEAKLRFFMNISHEIRTPMTLIVTPLLSLMKQDKDPQRQGIYETIKRNAERILHLINQMMDLRKIDKGMMQMRMQETDLVGFVGDIHSLFEHQAESKHITLRYEHDDERLPVWIDRQNFDKVIVNILSNAFKFTPSGGEIGIRVSHDANHAHITISDNGENIPQDKLDKIFERFYQTPSHTNDRNVGTGIGLDLTRSLVELHYGAIKAENLTPSNASSYLENSQSGVLFTVSIPLGNSHLKPEEMMESQEEEVVNPMAELEDIEEPLVEEETMNEGTSSTCKVIVIAEDDDEIRDFLETELSTEYEIHSCPNGREALAEIYRCSPDIVVSDVMMPEMDGNTLCSQLKLNPQTNHLPVILLTAKNRDEDKLEGLETGADAYIVKPFNMDILRRTIHNLIGSRQLMRQKYGRTEQLENQVEEMKMKSPDEKLLDRIMATINKHLNDSELSVDMIANEVGVSRVHLHRKMKELTGQTPHNFIRSLRIKQAAHLLSSQNMNITEVVYACGFSNPTSFSTIFKSVYGMTPREYMREHQK
ncbi:MAG: response regulator [Prevotella sp.]|nr:response regulator [Prevotella sp.]